jgi:hypothetical protein
VVPGWSPAILETVLGNCFPVLALSGDWALMLKRLALITSGHDVGTNSVDNLGPALIPDDPRLDGTMSSPCSDECLTHEWRSNERSSVRKSLSLPGTAGDRQAPIRELPADGREAQRLIFSDF